MIVTLLTDFGDADGFVGAMRGVILGRAPEARLVDIAHHVPRGDVAKAARVLERAAPWYPSGTVHCVVVDPGVGSTRRAIVATAGDQLFVAPDNGVLDLALDACGGVRQTRVIAHPDLRVGPLSSTFHGRDLFAPTAAALAAGFDLRQVGPPVDDAVRLPVSLVRLDGARLFGTVREVDTFGNLITDLPPGDVPGTGPITVELAGRHFEGPAPTYSAVPSGDLVLVVGSQSTLEVAIRDGSAADRLGVTAGTACTAWRHDPQSGR